MRAKNKTLPVLVAAIALVIAAAVGYVLPGGSQAMPVRILFNNKGGKVIFSHLTHHRDYQIECARCHHDRPQVQVSDKTGALACGSCHPQDFDKNFASSHADSFPDESYCIRCHHVEYGQLIFNHKEHAEEYADDCRACHHDASIEPEPRKCSDCHKGKELKGVPSMREAGHKKCASCHEDMFAKHLSSCKECHQSVDMTQYKGDYSDCGACHDAHARDLVLPRMNAFHDQCMSCHESLGAGPYGPDACNQCHITR